MAEENDDVTSEETLADETPEGQFVNGEFISNSELRDGYMRNAKFTQNSQALAEDRAAIEAQQTANATVTSDANAALALAESKEAALVIDTAWYGSHPQESWGTYQTEISKLSNGEVSVAPTPASAIDKETSARLDKIIQQNENRDKAERREALETRVDSVLAEVDRIRKADFPLADIDMVQSKIEAHQSLNGGRLPSNAEIAAFSKQIHDKFVKSGARVPKGIETESSKADVAPGSSANVGIGAKHTEIDLNADPDEAEHALKDFMAAKLAAQES
jgi:hypothetical protein